LPSLPLAADHAAGAGGPALPAPLVALAPSVKPFPWPAVTLDLGATAAALFFNLLLVSAFLAPTRTAVAGVVQEKELTLREGMRILGLQASERGGCCFSMAPGFPSAL
jgi:hypothetical protein